MAANPIKVSIITVNLNNAEGLERTLASVAAQTAKEGWEQIVIDGGSTDGSREVMEKYKNVRVDLTPGIEMYENFSADLQSTRAFFERYHDRILYGTDIGGRCVLMGEHKEFDDAENLRRPEIVREFLTGESEIEIASDGHFLINRPSFIMRPLALRGERLSEILGENFARFAGAAPRAVSDSAVLEECARLRKLMPTLSAYINDFAPDYSVLDYAESVFGIKQQ